jgi:hypothetical protein
LKKNFSISRSSICTRTLQVDCRVFNLNSEFCYILRTPINDENDFKNGKIFVWKGCKCDQYFYKIAEEVVYYFLLLRLFSVLKKNRNCFDCYYPI